MKAHAVRSWVFAALATCLTVAAAPSAAPDDSDQAPEVTSGPTLATTFGATEIALGEALEVVIEAVSGTDPESLPAIGPADVAPFTWLEGAWSTDDDGVVRWRGRVTMYDLGTFTFPSWRAPGDAAVHSAEQEIVVHGRLEEAEVEDPASLADLKAPAGIDPRWTPWFWALGGLVALGIAALLWRRYRARLAARLRAEPAVTDPFDRLPPHEWAYRELKALLATGWAEQGEIDRFHTRLSWVARRYLGGRYRIELMERTTSEIGPALRSAGADLPLMDRVGPLLDRLDEVKFAKAPADVEACRHAVEECYRLIDASRPEMPADDGPASADGGVAGEMGA